ncbi:conserved hypothetical protein [Desulfovibrionales bacterium]
MILLTRSWIFWASCTGLTALMLGLTVVWVNIERVDIAYELKQLQLELDKKQKLAAKFQVERNNLVSPMRLQEKAAEYGLNPARPGQIRCMDQIGDSSH